jgi:adenosylcobinamide-GDP ribazoletransferase
MRDALGLLTTFGRRGGQLRACALPWFPVVGAGLGALLGGLWWGADHVWPSALAAALVVLADLAATGMLHIDGLADAADGLLPHASRERRLEIMRTPDVGAFGVATVAIVLLLRVLALTAIAPSVILLAALWCVARSIVASVPALVPYARVDGMATPLLVGAPGWPVLASLPIAALAVATEGVTALAGVLSAFVAAAVVIAFARRQLGGFTGDVLGATIVVAETVGLVVAAARW